MSWLLLLVDLSVVSRNFNKALRSRSPKFSAADWPHLEGELLKLHVVGLLNEKRHACPDGARAFYHALTSIVYIDVRCFRENLSVPVSRAFSCALLLLL